uniref:Uncharacterized protein n=1 Tax=Picea glauca TaxID=3330 RepID=A0A117NHF9_PICGL|nr:hypothetical protein ABT39_MTgene5318 [Picea glauca]QHR88895.1 hypothetical protein Q903MT_gene2914 [Picea sitchensis]
MTAYSGTLLHPFVLLVLLMLLLMGMILRMLVVMLGPYSPTPLLSLVREVRSPLRCSRFN